MADITALIDANVFYGMTTTDIVIETARAGLFRARWTDDIHDEWFRNLLANQPGRSRVTLERRRKAMDAAVRAPLITGYEPLIDTLILPDPGDRHVLAAAVAGRCDVIVTFNLRHFPDATLTPHGVAAIHPDTFLVGRLDADEGALLACIKTSRQRLKNPPRSAAEYLARVAKAGLPLLASRLAAHQSLI